MNPSATTTTFNRSLLNDEINNMVSNITGVLNPNTVSGTSDEGEDAGFRIITISGTNTGATMKADRLQHEVMQANEIIYDGGEHEEDCLDAYANNNYQAVNNSVLIGGSYSADDPGVHVEMVNEKGDGDDGEEEEETEVERKVKE